MNSTNSHTTLKLCLHRYAHTNTITYGHLTGANFEAVTREREWLPDNKMMSCLPLGNYDVVRGGADDKTWYVLSSSEFPGHEIRQNDLKLPVARLITIVNKRPLAPTLSSVVGWGEKTTSFEDITKDLQRFRLQIIYAQPYAQYLRDHGYHQPAEE